MLDSLTFENEEIMTKCNKNAIIINTFILQYNSTLTIYFLYFKNIVILKIIISHCQKQWKHGLSKLKWKEIFFSFSFMVTERFQLVPVKTFFYAFQIV